MINKNENPDEGDCRLDNAKDASGEEASVGTGNTDTSEDCGAVVVDSVDTGAWKMLVTEAKTLNECAYRSGRRREEHRGGNATEPWPA